MAVQPSELTIAEQVEQAATLTSEPEKAEELYRAALSRKAGMFDESFSDAQLSDARSARNAER